ncbi:MAG: glycosyltransferase family 2 protein [Deltaproteobacteria bacterium]|nr:glycosyltransferase family 2 protein [Deltaproteobacteria bacterium]
MKKAAVIISPNYEDHARRYLKDCFESLKKQDWAGEIKIFITDNGSTAASFAFLKEQAPEAEIIRNETNDGFAKGNNDAMRRALEGGYDYIVLINMDTIVEAGCISRLVMAAESDSAIGAVQARLMLWPEKDIINSLGNATHFLGFGYCDGYGEEWSGQASPFVRNIAYASGAAALYKKEVLEGIGLFDEEFWMYNEDQDLGWRIWLAGGRCVSALQAVVYHKYDFSRNTRKYYWLDRNRILAMMKNYQAVTLLLIFPAFVVMEFGLLLFAWQKGWLRDKLYVYRYFLSGKNRRYILRARRKSQALRRVKDRDIVGLFGGRIWYDEVGSLPLRFVNHIMDIYWRVIKRIMVMKTGAVH